MKKLNLLLIKSLLTVFVCVIFVGCEGQSEPVTYYEMARVTKFERDSYATVLKYGNSGLSEYSVYINNEFAYSGGIQYKPSSIVCTMNGVRYDFQLANTKGVSRIESVMASIDGAPTYQVQYWFDDPEGRLTLARVDGVAGESNYISYKYEENKIIVKERTIDYIIELSSSNNLGYVCNVMSLTGPELTSNYVFNPDFYFLNIYGTPTKLLPQGYEVEISEDNQRLLRVGKYSYEY